jgi:hypothetical protein
LTSDSPHPSRARDRSAYGDTLIDSTRETEPPLHENHPTNAEISALWDAYLSHVHPMSKLFFDWDKAFLLKKAANDPRTLSKAEHAFTFAVYFITILSLSDSECKEIVSDLRRSEALDRYQAFAEAALHDAEYTATTDLLVLQAFLLYLVSTVASHCRIMHI